MINSYELMGNPVAGSWASSLFRGSHSWPAASVNAVARAQLAPQ